MPLGESAGEILRIGKLPININAHYYFNVEKPDSYGDYAVRFKLQFMFLK